MERQLSAFLGGGQFRQILENYVKGLKAKYGINRTGIEIIYYLSRCGEDNTGKDIASSLGKNKGLVSQSTEFLCEKGYLNAQRDEKDYRVVHYTITENARILTGEIEETIDRFEKALFKGVTPEEEEMFNRTIERMISNIKHLNTGGEGKTEEKGKSE